MNTQTDPTPELAARDEVELAIVADAGDTATTVKPRRRARKPAEPLTFPAAAEHVLRAADGPMKVKDIAELAIPLTATQGKTPAATLGARLITSANAGGTFIKTAPGTFDLRELNPRGAAKRPRPRATS
jgi:hypothetical protein